MISAMVYPSCTRGVQENAAICLVVLQNAEILGLIICFAIHFLCLTIEYTTNPRRTGVRCTTSALVCTCFTRGVQENCANCFVVLQTADILGLMICFALHSQCVTIE